MKKIYVAGRISGECETHDLMVQCWRKFGDYEDDHIFKCNYLFKPVEGKFVQYKGLSVTNGLRINANLENESWETYMKNCIPILIQCDEVHFLKDWKQSRGAKIEHKLCIDLNIKIVYEQ